MGVLKQREFAMYKNKQKRWCSQLEGSEGRKSGTRCVWRRSKGQVI